MEINLSNETITTVYNSLRNSRSTLKHQLEVKIPMGKVSLNKMMIIKNQLEEVEDALSVFEELMERI